MKRFLAIAILVIIAAFVVSPVYVFAQGSWRERFKNIQSESKSYKSKIPAGVNEGSIIVDGIKRTYLIHLPPQYREGSSLPLVFVLHGGGGTARNAVRMSNMNPKADKEGFIVVYPNGTGKLKDKLLTWNAGVCCGYSIENNIDDVKFFRLLIRKLKDQYNIDPKRIYVTGLSNGAMMSYVLACELSEEIAAIAPVAGSLYQGLKKPHRPVSVIIFNDTIDKHVPFDGGFGSESVVSVDHTPVSYAVEFWLENNVCSTIPKKESFRNAVKTSYDNCRGDSAVVLYLTTGGGHSWPGGREGILYGNVDSPVQDISATDLMWEFFKNHTKE